MKRGLITLTIAGLLVLAGCATTTGNDQTTTFPEPGTASMTDDSPFTTERTDTELDRGHPFGGETIDVYVMDRTGGDRDFTEHVDEALTYWNENSGEYGRYDASYRMTDSLGDADLVVRFVSDFDCGYFDNPRSETVGCAPIVSPSERVPDDDNVEVRILTGMSDWRTARVIKHEIGHTLGLTHGMEPTPLMNATTL